MITPQQKPCFRHPLDGVRKHLLMTKALASKIPVLYSQEEVKDPNVVVKFFSPYTGAVWLVTEFDGDDTLFGWAQVIPGGGELGYTSLDELQSLNQNGLPLVERDLYFDPAPLSEVRAQHEVSS